MKVGRMALVGIVVADGQPAGESDVVAGFAGHADVRLFGRSGRQIQTLGLGWSGGFGVWLLLGLLGCSRRLLGRGLLGGLLVSGGGILRRLCADQCRRPHQSKTK